MQQVLTIIGRLVADDDGQDLIEYGLLGVLIAVVAIAGVSALGETIHTVFWEVIANAL